MDSASALVSFITSSIVAQYGALCCVFFSLMILSIAFLISIQYFEKISQIFGVKVNEEFLNYQPYDFIIQLGEIFLTHRLKGDASWNLNKPLVADIVDDIAMAAGKLDGLAEYFLVFIEISHCLWLIIPSHLNQFEVFPMVEQIPLTTEGDFYNLAKWNLGEFIFILFAYCDQSSFRPRYQRIH